MFLSFRNYTHTNLQVFFFNSTFSFSTCAWAPSRDIIQIHSPHVQHIWDHVTTGFPTQHSLDTEIQLYWHRDLAHSAQGLSQGSPKFIETVPYWCICRLLPFLSITNNVATNLYRHLCSLRQVHHYIKPSSESAEPKSMCIFFFRLLLNCPAKKKNSCTTSWSHPQHGRFYLSPSADSRSLAGNRRALRTTTSINAFPSQFQPFPLTKKTMGQNTLSQRQLGPGSFGEVNGLIVAFALLIWVQRLVFLSHCITEQPDSVNKLSESLFRPRKRKSCFRVLQKYPLVQGQLLCCYKASSAPH